MNTITPSFGMKYYISGNNSRNASRYAGTNRTNNLFGEVRVILNKANESCTASFHTGSENRIVLENPPKEILNKLFNAKIEFFNEGAFKAFKNM